MHDGYVLTPLDIFKLVQLHCTGPRPLPLSSAMFKLVHYEVWTIGERSLGIRLKYLLVYFYRPQTKFGAR